VAALHAERIALDRAAQELGGAAAQLDQWLAGNERALAAVTGAGAGAAGEGGGATAAAQLDPDSVIVAADPLSQQALEVQVCAAAGPRLALAACWPCPILPACLASLTTFPVACFCASCATYFVLALRCQGTIAARHECRPLSMWRMWRRVS
jgi:hypothetical protein